MNGIKDESNDCSDRESQESSEGEGSGVKAEEASVCEETSGWSAFEGDGEANASLDGEDPLASPNHNRSGKDGSIDQASGKNTPINDDSAKNSQQGHLDHDQSGKISPIDRVSGPTSPVNEVSGKNSPDDRNRSGKDSPDRLGSKSCSPNRPSRDSASPQRAVTSSTEEGRSQAASPVDPKSGSGSPVNINSDTESEGEVKNTGMIDLESDDDCILVEEGKKKASALAVDPPVAPAAPVLAAPAQTQDADPLSDAPDTSGPRRSRRNTKRKSYQLEDDDDDDPQEEEEDSSDSETGVKRKKVTTPSKPVTFAPPPQIKLVNTSLLMANKVNNFKVVNQTNGMVSKQVFTNMAQRGVSIQATPRAVIPTPPKKKVPVVPPPPFAKDSIFAGMTNGQSLVEAPSFLSPLIFVKKPIASLRAFVDELGVEVRKREEAEAEVKRLKELEEKEAKRIQDEADLEAKRLKDLADGVVQKEEESQRLDRVNEGGDSTPMELGAEDSVADEVKKEVEKEAGQVDEVKTTEPKKKGRRRRKDDENDESWSEKESEYSSDESDDGAQKTQVLVQEALDPLTALAPVVGPPEERTRGYFASPLGGFFLELGLSLVQERVHTDLFRLQQKRMRREPHARQDMEGVMQFLSSNIQRLKQANCHLNLSRVRCQFCSFRTESALVMAHHMEVPHPANTPGGYRCNFCPMELVGPQAALAHVSAAHGVTARLVKPQALHQCPECPFESGTRGRFTKHLERCLTLAMPDVLKPQEWQPPAKLIKASARPNYIFNSRPRFSHRSVAPLRPLGPPFPQIMGPRAPRPRAPAVPVVTCGVCGSKWSDAARLRDHVLRDHAKALSAVATT